MALQDFKCPNCGGAIQYNPGTTEMTCPYCDSVMDVEALNTMGEDMANREPEAINWGYSGDEWLAGEQKGMAVYSCQSCSGEIVCDQSQGATTCPFCDNPVVMTSMFSGTLRPDMLIPFKLNKDEALKSLQNHYLGKKLLPRVFKDRNHLEEIKGVYIPFWLYDADAEAQVEYRATKMRTWSDRKFNYTETSVYRVFREGGIGFSQVPVDGSKAIDDTLMESVEPFETGESVGFNPAYLAGYYANKYDVDSAECNARANERIKNSTASMFMTTVTGYASVEPVDTRIRLKKGEIKYALFPVWLLSTVWQGQSYTFAMNGQTGRFVGNLPLDKGAYWSWFIKIFGIAAAALLLITQTVVSLM